MKKIVVIGQTTYDTTYVVDEYPRENRKIKAKTVYSMGGGSAGNAAYLLAKYNEDVSLISTFGKDKEGQIIKKEYESVGLDTRHCIIKDNFVTPNNTVVLNSTNGTRTIIGYKPKNIIPEDYCFTCNVTRPEIIYCDGYETHVALELINMFPDLKVVIDAGALRAEFVEIAPYSTHFICSEDFAMEYCKIDFIKEENFNEVLNRIEQLCPNTVAITLGDRGCIYRDKGELKHIPAFKTKVVDTTGAGDIFHGAFTYALSHDLPLYESLVFSSACSALSVSKIGGQTSIPELQDVYNLIDKKY